MSPDDDPPGAVNGTGEVETGTAPNRVEQSIDAVDWLRKHMRQAGMEDCADALDDAFAKCLKAYLDLQNGAGLGSETRTHN